MLAGRAVILLRNYPQYIVGEVGSLMNLTAPAA
jgi:hypothetical protein